MTIRVKRGCFFVGAKGRDIDESASQSASPTKKIIIVWLQQDLFVQPRVNLLILPDKFKVCTGIFEYKMEAFVEGTLIH